MGAGISGIAQYERDQQQRIREQTEPMRKIQQKQQQQADEFRSNLPQYQQTIAQNLRTQGAQQLSEEEKGVKSDLSQRGLLYGGVGQGQIGRTRAAAGARLGNAVSSAQRGLESQAQQMETNAISSAQAVQNAQQEAQNQLYSQSMAQQNGMNKMIGGALGLIAAPFTMGGSLAGVAKGLLG